LVRHRAKTDKKFAEALLREGIDALVSGEVDTGRTILRDTSRPRSASRSSAPQPARRPRA
jgi:hypothetical protein